MNIWINYFSEYVKYVQWSSVGFLFEDIKYVRWSLKSYESSLATTVFSLFEDPLDRKCTWKEWGGALYTQEMNLKKFIFGVAMHTPTILGVKVSRQATFADRRVQWQARYFCQVSLVVRPGIQNQEWMNLSHHFYLQKMIPNILEESFYNLFYQRPHE